MDWNVLRASLDFGLRTSGPEVEFIFSGGEPLLEMDNIERAVAYVGRNRPDGLEVRYSVLTNGTLLDESIISFLAEHDFEMQMSCDGIPESQDRRSPGSLQVLGDWLDYLGETYPAYYRRRCTIATVVGPDTVATLPRSVAWFLDKRVPTVLLAPEFTDTSRWRTEDIDGLRSVFEEIADLSRRHFLETGDIPLRMFRSPLRPPTELPLGRSLCGIMRGEKPSVDTDGRVFGCGTVVGSYQEVPSREVRACLECIALGSIDDPQLAGRLAGYRERTRAVGLFDNKQRNRSSYGRCGECERLSQCAICPVSIGYIPDNDDFDRVPDFLCAWNLVSLECRERFRAQPPSGYETIMEA